MSTKQLITRIAMAIVIVCGTATTAKAQLGRLLEISFDYQVQPGPGSNQFAVWIENTNGEVVKTIFVTSYTTKGRARGEEKPKRGYLVRPNCVPKWVKIAKPDTKLDAQLDAVTGATPKENGTQTFVWDFRDDLGNSSKATWYIRPCSTVTKRAVIWQSIAVWPNPIPSITT